MIYLIDRKFTEKHPTIISSPTFYTVVQIKGSRLKLIIISQSRRLGPHVCQNRLQIRVPVLHKNGSKLFYNCKEFHASQNSGLCVKLRRFVNTATAETSHSPLNGTSPDLFMVRFNFRKFWSGSFHIFFFLTESYFRIDSKSQRNPGANPRAGIHKDAKLSKF